MSSSHLSLVVSDDTAPSGDHHLAIALSEAALALHAATGTDAILTGLLAAAVRLVPGAQDASIRLTANDHQVASPRSIGTAVSQVDTEQLHIGEGPCLEAMARAQPVRVPDMGHEQRWPAFTRRARQLGIGSTLSLPLVRASVLGSLNLYSRHAEAFDDQSEEIGLLLSTHVSAALANASTVDHLTKAVASRDLIGQAKGILMARYGLDQGRAFDVLRRVSQQTHRKLHDVAEELATTGEIAALPRTDATRSPQ